MVFASWKTICSPWHEGGLNIKELLSWNKAVLARWLWSLANHHDGLWCCWNIAYNMGNFSIWDTLSKPHHPESLRGILAVKEEILSKTGTVSVAHTLINSWVRNGKFHFKAAYDWFRSPAPALPWAPALNSHFLIPSHKLLTSLAIQGKLATLDKLAARGFSLTNRCILTYDPAQELLWCIGKRHLRHWKNGWIRCYIGAICYHIWAERNARIFLGIEKTVAQLIHVIRNTVSSRILGKVPSKDYEKAVHRLTLS
ncbi:uncharacterized protein LOC141601210 [Silene latifolia]|uniref:uncharacterized protein LOC141601210 n=1 Tax=Silene latifolia TaxID=37657 RepID=UPI003D76F94E